MGAGQRREAVGPEGRQGGVDAAEAPVDTKDALRVLSQTAAVLQRHAHFLDLEQRCDTSSQRQSEPLGSAHLAQQEVESNKTVIQVYSH